MKKIFTCMAIAALAMNIVASASVTMSETGSVSLEGIISNAENASSYSAMAYSGSDLYVSGVYDTPFGGFDVIGASSYVIKYDANLSEKWKVSILGSATVTSMLADNDGGVYVAGTFADEVEFGSTNGSSIIRYGYQESGAYTVTQAASFIAHYDKDGVLLAVGDILPEHVAALDATGMYFPYDGDIYCTLNNLFESDGVLYASAVFTGQLSNAESTQTAVSGSYDAFGIGFYMLSRAGVVIELNGELEAASFPVIVNNRDFTELITSEEVRSLNATADGNTLYVGTISTGLTNFNVYGNDQTVDVPLSDTGIGYVFGYTVASVNLDTHAVNVLKEFDPVTTDDEYISTSIDAITVSGDNLFITGLFQGALGFDQQLQALGSNDMFAASLNKSTFEVNWASATGFDEGDATVNEEIMNGSVISGNCIYLYGRSELKKDYSAVAPLFYAVNPTSGEMSAQEFSDYTIGVAGSNGGALITRASTEATVTGIKFTTYDVTGLGVNAIAEDLAAAVTMYPNPVVDIINFSASCDVTVLSLDGRVVLKANDVNSLDVAGLNNGVYIVNALSEGQSYTLKMIKK